MDNLRGLVSGQGCDDGSTGYRNPLNKFVDHMLRDKSQREHGEWNRNLPPALNNQHEPTLRTHSNMVHREINGFLDGFASDKMGRINNYDPLQTLNNQEVQEVGEFMNGGIRLSPHVREKLNVPPHLGPDMVREYLAQFSTPEEANFQHMPQHFGEFDPDQMANEFSNMHLNAQQPHMNPEEMERYWKEVEETERMANAFDEFRSQREFEQFYAEANETERWVDEFEGARPIERVNDNIQSLSEAIRQIDDPRLQNSNFMKFINKMATGEVSVEGNQVIDNGPIASDVDAWASEFETGNFLKDVDPQSEEWAREFEQKFPTENPMYNESWLNQYEDFETEQWLREYHSANHLKEYEFTDPAENPYVDHPQPFNKALELFQEGKLTQSILAFEAELLNNPQNSKCWEFLGRAHAENDKDGRAISALLHAIDADPSNLDAFGALAVSYTNDLYRDQALDVLKQWIEKNEEYSHLRLEDNEAITSSFDNYHKAITDLYIRAARQRPNDPDPDVQTALGLLFNLSLDYDKAVDCFKAALTVRPDDYQLWNKLGATLANSNRSEEAIGCYFNALQIKPTYVRARANLGISFMALADYERAATYFLGALNMHPNAKHIWSNLHMVFLSMGREDLVKRSIENEGNVDVFRDTFDF